MVIDGTAEIPQIRHETRLRCARGLDHGEHTERE